jgi:hypothetical protein
MRKILFLFDFEYGIESIAISTNVNIIKASTNISINVLEYIQ